MYNHEPSGYKCPFCNLLAGNQTEYNRDEDIVFQNEKVIAIIAPTSWVKNQGHVLVIPKTHYENIYDTPDEILAEVSKVTKKIAIAIRSSYEGCEGISTRQHNELVSASV